MFAPARKGRISCAVKSNAKNLRGLGKERRLIFLWLVLFSRRGTGYEILTSSVYVFTAESHLPLAGHAPHVSCFVPKVFFFFFFFFFFFLITFIWLQHFL